jgi:small-conductance mechanosensitive channel
MKNSQKTVLAILLLLVIAALGAALFTRSWADYRSRLRAIQEAARHSSEEVDTRPLDTAQQLAALAVTHTEQGYAQEAVRLGDRSVDLAFAAALEDATDNPAPLTPQTRALTARVEAAEAKVATDQDRVAQLKQQLDKARESAKDKIQQDLDLAEAQSALDQDELDDAHQDLIRAGGDRHATIQQLLAQHEASAQHGDTAHPAAAGNNAEPTIEGTRSQSVLAQLRAWRSLGEKQKLLRQAQASAASSVAKLTVAHEALEKQLSEEKAQKKILHKKKTGESPPVATESAPGSTPVGSEISFIRQLQQDQKKLSQLDERIEMEQQLAALYGNWVTYLNARKEAFAHGMFVSAFWILLIALCVFVAHAGVGRFFADLAPERRQLHTLRAVTLFALQALGVILILLVFFGMPNNLGTLVALAGAGLTIALKDFILGFFGWFVLMGKNGIRPGDWVEINGVGGEVLEVGPLRTVLLETGNWSDAAHPTGRKATFMNSFAIEGHYFNFSTTGQWLWDELQVQVPQSADPYSLADAIQKIAANETAANANLAEQEWQRVTPSYARHSFSAAPSLTVRPTGTGVTILVRYITRAHERQEVRSRLYRAAVDILHKKKIPEAAPTKSSAQGVTDRP